MRVIFDISGESSDNLKKDRHFYINRKYLIDKYINRNEPFYIIGGMSGEKIVSKNYIKTLSERDTYTYINNIQLGEYNVTQISDIPDIKK